MLHVIGGGLAGLAASTAALRAGFPVTLYEATGQAGGRCRSYHDQALDTIIDNGTHLVLSVNQTALSYARAIGGLSAMTKGPSKFPFANLSTGARWTLTPWSLLQKPLHLLKALGLPALAEDTTVHDSLGRLSSYPLIWEPLCVAALNTETETASAPLFAKLLRMALKMGLSSLTPWTFPHGLSAAFVQPALDRLREAGAPVHFNRRLKGISADRIDFDGASVTLGPDDRVILAVPPWAARALLPQSPALGTRSIINGHFRLDQVARLTTGQPWLGLTGGLGQWVSIRDDVASVTISAANAVEDKDNSAIAQQLWREIAAFLGMAGAPLPARHRIVREKRATLAHTPDQVRLRPGHRTALPHVFLAGDWLRSDWPCTIEAALLSGLAAARLATGCESLAF